MKKIIQPELGFMKGYSEGYKSKEKDDEYLNSFSSLVSSIVNGGWEGSGTITRGTQVSQADTLWKNNRNYFISNFRYLLSQSYIEHGIIQVMVDLPIDDAFRTGVEFRTDDLSKEEKVDVQEFIEEKRIIDVYKQSLKWGRLFGGGAMILMSGDDMSKPLDIDKLHKKPVEFIDVDLWELYYGETSNNLDTEDYRQRDFERLLYKPDIYNYYGEKIHNTRVFRIEGKRAPSFVRPRLRGWGFSVLESIIRGFNQYLKGVSATFEMLDEVKVDVYSINNFAMSLMSPKGEAAVRKRILLAQHLKNFLNALVLDKNDEYHNKSNSGSFSGLAEVMKEVRYQIASDTRMPISKIFGIGSSGFSSGEDDIKNYNTMIETEVRSKVVNELKKIYRLAAKIAINKDVKKLDVSFGTLDYETPKDLNIRKNSEFQRIILAYERNLISIKEVKEMFNKQELLPIGLEINDKIFKNNIDPKMNIDVEDGNEDEDEKTEIGLKELKTKSFG